MSDEMSARKALKFKEKEERGEIQHKEKDIISRQPQVPYEPYHPGLMIEAQNPQLNEGISRNFNELKKSTTSQGPPRSYLKYPNFIIPHQNVIPEFQKVHQAPARHFTEPNTFENELLYTPTPSPENIILMPKQRVAPEQLSIFNNPSHRPIHPEIASIIQHPPRRPIEVPSQQPESNQSPYIYTPPPHYTSFTPPPRTQYQPTYSPISRISVVPQPQPQPQPQPIQQQSQVQQIKETQTETNVSNEAPFYMFFDKNKDQRYLKPMTKQQLSELRQQDITRKGSKVLSANRYNRKKKFIYKNNFFTYIYININDRPRTIKPAFI